LSESLQRLAMKSTVAGAAMTPMTQMLAAAALSAVISVALVQSASSGTSVGGFVAFVTAMLMIIAPVRQLSEVSSPITRGLVSLERALALINQTADESSGHFSQTRAAGMLTFSELTVQYPSALEPALSISHLTIRPGETVALVGASGSGKTTLINVLTRFVDMSSGQVFLDDHELRDWQLPSLRSQFSLVSQQVVMINDSVAANIALGLPYADDLAILAAAETAGLREFVDRHPRGLDMPVGERGELLSGGQRQAVGLARAVLHNAPILLLDEPTSAMDFSAEAQVLARLSAFAQGRTVVLVTHRTPLLALVQRTVVIDQGRVVADGPREEVLASLQGGRVGKAGAA